MGPVTAGAEVFGVPLPVALAALAVVVVLLYALVGGGGGKAGGGAKAATKKGKKASAGGAGRAITREEVAKHASRDDVWLILDGKVYDVTPYVDEHPGGDTILKNAGGDSTEGFHGPQHPGRVFDLIEDFCIGTLAESDKTK